MSFRKRNIGIQGSSTLNRSGETTSTAEPHPVASEKAPRRALSALGVRPSPLDGSPITSTGTPSLDGLLAGYAGLVLGNLLLVEESGATDYAGTLLRYYAAEGILQKHRVHIIGVNEHWVRDLPGVATTKGGVDAGEKSSKGDSERMKIAWRYERFGDPTSRGMSTRGIFSAEASNYETLDGDTDVSGTVQPSTSSQGESSSGQTQVFCHTFDLTKRMELQDPSLLNILSVRSSSAAASPFTGVLKSLAKELSSDSSYAVHRVVIPGVLSPAFYPPESSLPQHILQFFHALRSLLRTHKSRLSAMMSLPISLYPRESGLTRWMEHLSDGVIELAPFPHTVDAGPTLATSGAATAQEEKPQGMAKIHRLPVVHERGGGVTGGAGVGDDLAFTVTRRRFVIKPFSLPPIEGDTDAQKGEVDGRPTKVDIEF